MSQFGVGTQIKQFVPAGEGAGCLHNPTKSKRSTAVTTAQHLAVCMHIELHCGKCSRTPMHGAVCIHMALQGAPNPRDPLLSLQPTIERSAYTWTSTAVNATQHPSLYRRDPLPSPQPNIERSAFTWNSPAVNAARHPSMERSAYMELQGTAQKINKQQKESN